MLAVLMALLGDVDGIRVLPCRPTISCSADLVPPGAVEIEAGYAARHVEPRGFIHAEPLLFKLTLVEWLQAQMGNNAYVSTTGRVSRSLRYYDDLSFGLKTHFLDQTASLPSLAFSGALSIPSFNPPSDFPFAYDSSFWGYATKDMGPLHFDLNGGLNIWQFDLPERSVQVFSSLAGSTAVTKHFGVMMEVYGFSDAGRIAPKDGGLLMGFSYAPSPSWMFDVGEDVSMFPSTRRITLFAGVTLVPFRLWGSPASHF
jgi:hypothetical protein